VPQPHEVLLSGRLAALPALQAELAGRLRHVASVRPVTGLGTQAKAAAQGAALLADGLAGGRFARLVDVMELRGASGSALDNLRLRGAGGIEIA
jgi:predicted butyrate kinase (DUF1464 family)